MDPEQAALAVAQAALEEAAAQERLRQQRSVQMPVPMMDPSQSSVGNTVQYMDPMQVNNQVAGVQDVDLLQTLLNLPDDNARNQFIQLFSQQQQQQQNEMMEAIQTRPEKHYLTISAEGENRVSCFIGH